MGRDSLISWCHHTFNPWWGCFKISPGCAHCYAATFDKRVHGKDTDHWSRDGSRRFFTEAHWKEPLRWNTAAHKAGVRHRVFCASMSDWAEIHPDPAINRQLDALRVRLFQLIADTPHLDWLLLTKRIENVPAFLPWMNGTAPRVFWNNVWIGTTAEDQDHADLRVPPLLKIPAIVHWLSLEPLLGPIDLENIRRSSVFHTDALAGLYKYPIATQTPSYVDWVVAGAESGPKARACSVEWLRSLRDQVARAGRKFLLKQATQEGSEAVGGPLITVGVGSRTKGRGHSGKMIELPYLDGRQHEEYPEVHHAA